MKEYNLEKVNLKDLSKGELIRIIHRLDRKISELKIKYTDGEYEHDIDWYKHEYCAECDRSEQLERALDKACEMLEKYDEAECEFMNFEERPMNKEQWKEYLMNNNES